jgi:hypothetical protein
MAPRNLAIGNSGQYNMASGTLDRQMYRFAIDQERTDCGEEVLDEDLKQWWYAAIRLTNYFEDEITPREMKAIRATIQEFPSLRESPPDHTYRWDEVPEHTDPVKVAQAIDILHKGGHVSDIDIQEKRFNRRAEDHYNNLEKQNEARDRLDMPVNPQPVAPDGNNLDDDDEDDNEDDNKK